MGDREGWNGGEGKASEFMAILQQMEKQQEGAREGEVPRQLLEEVEFDRSDPQQRFYRSLQQLSSKELLLRKLGWRVVQLAPEEQDLTLYCFSILSAESIIPLTFFTTEQAGRKVLWLQIGIHVNERTASESHHSMETNIYQFVERRLLPLLRDFVRENINWSRMAQPTYSDEGVVAKFRAEVVAVVNDMVGKEDFQGRK